MIIDNDLIEYTKRYDFYLRLQNGTYHDHFSDYTRIRVLDNEGWFSVSVMYDRILLVYKIYTVHVYIIVRMTLLYIPCDT